MEWKFQLDLLNSWWNFSLVYREEFFARNHNSIFMWSLLNIQDEISSKMKFQLGSAFKIELFVKITIRFHKRLHLRCFTGFWMCLCCEYDNYLSVNFPTQPYLLLCLWWFKVLSLSIFPIFYETLTPALQLGTKLHRKDCWHLPICSCITEGCFLHYSKS